MPHMLAIVVTRISKSLNGPWILRFREISRVSHLSDSQNAPDRRLLIGCGAVPCRELVKLVTCVLQNAVKFTENATISIQAIPDLAKQALIITIHDNGPGIEPAFRPRIFEAFARQDSSITRQTEGLGLGLAVAKGIADKLGGSLSLVWTETIGPQQGTVFYHMPSLPLCIHTDSYSRPLRSYYPKSEDSSQLPPLLSSTLALPPKAYRQVTHLRHAQKQEKRSPNPTH